MRPELTLVVFAISYALIATRRLALLPIGRPAGAMLGAVAMVALGALSPEAAFDAIDGATLVVLFGTMALSAYVETRGLFARLLVGVRRVAHTPRRLLWLLAFLPGVLSALLLNDAVCLFLTPLVVRACKNAKLPYEPYLMALATSANLGSAATLVGNPQNMLVGSLGDLAFGPFLRAVGPAALVGLFVNAFVLDRFYARRLPAELEASTLGETTSDERGWRFASLVVAALGLALVLGANLPFSVLAAVLVFVVADRRDPQESFARVDLSLLVFFASLFVVVAGLQSTGYVDDAFAWMRGGLGTTNAADTARFTAAITLGANTVSNVPLVLLVGPYVESLGDPVRTWTLLAWVSTVAGNLTLVGSAANVIVAEGAKSEHDLGFWTYAKVGVPSTLLVLAVGTPIVWLLAG
ncbi:MAG: anion transporter [Sandaracinus sp.]|nr:anion transporter [Sandaracinus sp.]